MSHTFPPDILCAGVYDAAPTDDEPTRAARGVVRVPAQIAYPVDADGRPPPEPDDDERPPELGDPPSGFRSE